MVSKTFLVVSNILAFITGGLVIFLVQSYSAPSRTDLEGVTKLVRAGDYTRAQRELERHLRENPDDAQAHLKLAGVMLGLGSQQAALEHLQQVPNTSAWALEARYREGQVFRELGRGGPAEEAWYRCIGLDESFNPQAMGDIAHSATVELLKLYLFQRRIQDGTELIWIWYKRVPADRRAHALMALLHLEFSQGPAAEEVIPQLNKFLVSDPQDRHSRSALGRIYFELAENEESARKGRDELKTCVEQQPNDIDSLAAYVWCLTEEGDIETAQAALASLPEGAERSGELWHWRGVVLSSAKRWDEAGRCFRQALTLQPWRKETHAYLANVLRNQGDLKGAQEHEKRQQELVEIEEHLRAADQALEAAQVRPDAESAFRLAELYEKREQTREAQAWYDETLRQDPDHEGARKAIMRVGRIVVER